MWLKELCGKRRFERRKLSNSVLTIALRTPDVQSEPPSHPPCRLPDACAFALGLEDNRRLGRLSVGRRS